MDKLIRRRVYGADHDEPGSGPRTGHAYRELVGGPLDGLLLDVTEWNTGQLAAGAALPTEIGAFRPGGRSTYGPRRAGDGAYWDWRGDIR
ncbi:hypothetical protein [Streptomyces sp. NPDC051098]|uniref:hypothetical protein n=1 Tax=Streptomyces sp. NPDC051098 TaxID=3155411 RepID=UPI003429978C